MTVVIKTLIALCTRPSMHAPNKVNNVDTFGNLTNLLTHEISILSNNSMIF